MGRECCRKEGTLGPELRPGLLSSLAVVHSLLHPPHPANAPELCPHNSVGILPVRDSRFFPSSAYSCSLHQTLPIILSQHQRNSWMLQQNPLWKSSSSEKKKKEKRRGSTMGVLFLQNSEHPLQVSGFSWVPVIPSRPQYHMLYPDNKVSWWDSSPCFQDTLTIR